MEWSALLSRPERKRPALASPVGFLRFLPQLRILYVPKLRFTLSNSYSFIFCRPFSAIGSRSRLGDVRKLPLVSQCCVFAGKSSERISCRAIN
jgi:hypothetical protein